MSLLRRNMILIALVALVSGSVGALAGIGYYKKTLQANAVGFWLKGGESIEKKQYDYALLYFTQAVALKNDEPFFLESMARTYETTQNLPMALKFYRLELAEYKKLKTGPVNQLEQKVKRLEEGNGVSR